jgi:[ribosomal protein S18]-alanine N-acetyltransferase
VAAIGLYRRFGYAPAGVRKNYYSDEGEDGLIMWAHDIHMPAHRARLDTIAAEVAAR